MKVAQRLELGDSDGHPFHGNQWTGGKGEADWTPSKGDYVMWDTGASSTLVEVIGVRSGEVVIRYTDATGAMKEGSVADDSVHAVSERELADLSGVVDPLSPNVDTDVPSALSSEVREDVQEFQSRLWDEHPDFASSLASFSMNSPDTSAALDLRAALVEVAGGDRELEYVNDQPPPYADWTDQPSVRAGHITDDVWPSDDLMQAASEIHQRYDSTDPGLDRTVTLYRGTTQLIAGDDETVNVNVLSSWTPTSQGAEMFGYPVRAEVPIRQIVGMGAIGEDEVYVYSPDQEIVAKRIR